MNKAGLSILTILLLLMLASCSSRGNEDHSDSKTADKLPEVQIVADGTELQVQSRAVAVYDDSNAELFQSLVGTADASFIPYIKLGSAVEIVLNGITPDAYRLTEYILNKDGSLKYAADPASQQSMVVSFQDGAGAFILKPNPKSSLSSLSTDYEPGATIRGFRFSTSIGGQMKEYAFVLRSDATEKAS